MNSGKPQHKSNHNLTVALMPVLHDVRYFPFL